MRETQFTKIRIGKTNTYLLQSDLNFYILIDCAVPGRGNNLISRFKRLGITSDMLKLIIITHSHYDHAGCLAEIKSWSNAKVAASEYAMPYLSKGKSPLPIAINHLLNKLIKSLSEMRSDLDTYEPVKVDILITKKYDLKDWGIDGYLLPTPGHTKDSISLIMRNGNAFVGDALFNITPFSIVPPFQNYPEELQNSWNLLLKTGSQYFHPGHGPVISAKRFRKHLIKN